MNNEFLNCDCCGEAIDYGKPYVCISQRIEVARHSDADDTDETEVVDSNLILVMCKKCGNKYNAQYFNAVVNAIPFRAKRTAGSQGNYDAFAQIRQLSNFAARTAVEL